MLLLPAPKKPAHELLREADERLRADVARFNKFLPAGAHLPQYRGLRNYQIQTIAALMAGAAEYRLPTGWPAVSKLGMRPGELLLVGVVRGAGRRLFSHPQNFPKIVHLESDDAHTPK